MLALVDEPTHMEILQREVFSGSARVSGSTEISIVATLTGGLSQIIDVSEA
ncbi:hypothetical protein MUP07_04340 [Candidatus Bathyarchaeota archaeon]|nr:hypothetical protein [Candidatus Bathyarchaeota archaeon]